MNAFELWFLRRIFARQVMQGIWHEQRITRLYRLIKEAAEEEFTEDNKVTRDAYLLECFKRAHGIRTLQNEH